MSVSLKNYSKETASSTYRVPVIYLCSDDESLVDVDTEKFEEKAKHVGTNLSDLEVVEQVNIIGLFKSKCCCIVNQKMKGKAGNAAPTVIAFGSSDESIG